MNDRPACKAALSDCSISLSTHHPEEGAEEEEGEEILGDWDEEGAETKPDEGTDEVEEERKGDVACTEVNGVEKEGSGLREERNGMERRACNSSRFRISTARKCIRF